MSCLQSCLSNITVTFIFINALNKKKLITHRVQCNRVQNIEWKAKIKINRVHLNGHWPSPTSREQQRQRTFWMQICFLLINDIVKLAKKQMQKFVSCFWILSETHGYGNASTAAIDVCRQRKSWTQTRKFF